MKNLIVFIFLFVSTGLLAQSQKDSPTPKIGFGFGFNFGLESLDKMKAEDVGVAQTGYTIIDFRGRMTVFKYVMVDLGLSVSHFKDKLPFSQAVVFTSGQLSGLPSNATSKITSGSFTYSLGGRVPLMERLYVNASAGERRFSASRGIPSCDDCNKTDIDLKAGTFVRGGISWMSFKKDGNPEGEVDVWYTHYFDQQFQRTINIGFLAYF